MLEPDVSPICPGCGQYMHLKNYGHALKYGCACGWHAPFGITPQEAFEAATKRIETHESKKIIKGLIDQFAYVGQHNGHLAIHTGGLSALESAFEYLGLSNPHETPENECEIESCTEEATCGVNTVFGYKSLCYKHCCEYEINV